MTEHRERLTGIMLPLHGATVTTEEEDPDGDLLAALRELVGPSIPIVATFDTHVHGTARMARAADALVGFKTQPHVDHYETATLAMGILVRRDAWRDPADHDPSQAPDADLGRAAGHDQAAEHGT